MLLKSSSSSKSALILRFLGAVLFGIISCQYSEAQSSVSVGGGSYATSIPTADQFVGGYYSMSAQQVVNYFTNLHLAASVTNRPIPSNKWWTDELVGDRSYQPAANEPRTIVQDPFGGQLWAYPSMVAPNSSGFDLYFPNEWTPTGANPAVPQGAFETGPALQITGGITPAVGSNDILIADFDETNYPMGWVTTGTAFGTGPIVGGSWPGESPAVQGFVGPRCVNTYRGANTPQGTLTSPTFTIQKHYLQLLVGGGADTNNDAVKLVIGTNIIYSAAGNQSGTLFWNTWDVSAYLGQTAQIEVVDTTSASWGFVLCSWIVATDDGSNPAAKYTSTFTPLNSEVTDWSDWGFRFGLPDGQARRMDLTLARGVPFVWTTYTGLEPQIGLGSANLYDTNGNVISTASGSFTNNAFAFNYQGSCYGIYAPDNTAFTVSGNNLEAQLSGTNNYLVFGLLPAITNLAEFEQYAFVEVTNTTYAWNYDIPNGRVVTTWNLATSPLKGSGTNTLQGWLPHQYRTTTNNLVFKPYTYLTPRGIMQVSSGNQFEIGYNFRGIAPVLPAPHVNNLPNDYVASRMSNYLNSFVAGNPYYSGDTYSQGKELGILAQYMSFATQLGMTAQAAQLEAGVCGILTNWLSYAPGKTSYLFARYNNWRALIGFPPGYGSEAFNDNHFHYGYFMVASALLGMMDTNFLTQYGPMAQQVAKEYANWDRSDTNFPFLRTFDIWEGHSWAGGFSSGGGNNQESSSEAMQSWVGLFLMGNMLGDTNMAAAGAMGYAVESAAVNEYWQDEYRTNLPASYGKGGVGILQSGGVAYGTYFSGDPAWVYGIQWVPANHWNNYLSRNPAFSNWQLTNMWHERVIASENDLNGFTLTDANNAVSQGAYLGNYILGFQLLFDPSDVATIMDDAYATNAGIATDPTYSGVTYYLTHTLRALGNQDLNYYTSLPTSQVYYNSTTGARTYVIYNPTSTNQTVTIYNQGVPVDSVPAPAGVLTVQIAGQTHASPTIVATIQRGAQIAWPTTANTSWTLQAANGPGSGVNWTTLLGPTPGNGTSNTIFDPLWPEPDNQYQVLQVSSGTANILVNGGFEYGNGTAVSNWSEDGSQPPIRINTDSHSGSYCMELSVTNSASTPNTSQIDQNVAGQGGVAVVPGQVYSLSFWAKQLSSGVSYVQNYGISWLNNGGGLVGNVGLTGFSGGNGVWSQIDVNNLTAPTNAVNAYVQIYGTTGAVPNGYGGVLIDDVALNYGTPSQTNVISAVVQPGVQVNWPSTPGNLFDVQWTGNPGANNWSNLASSLPDNGSTNTVTDTFGTNQFRFYRIFGHH
jgi:endoglucanase Acf2